MVKKIFYGIGFDVHRLVPKRKLYLGGIKIPSSLGTLGHSDGDPVLHAVTDSILGACKMGDIGEKFSNKNKKYKVEELDEINQNINFYRKKIDLQNLSVRKLNIQKNKILSVIKDLISNDFTDLPLYVFSSFSVLIRSSILELRPLLYTMTPLELPLLPLL